MAVLSLKLGTLAWGSPLSLSISEAHQGSLHVGGSYSGPGYALNSAPGSQPLSQLGSRNLSFNFEAARSALTGKSASLASAQATGISSLGYSTLTLQGMDAALYFFNVDARSLALASMLNLVIPGTAKALINVPGTVARMSNMGFGGGFRAEHTLFNFYEATSLSLHRVGIVGSLLAPKADVDFSSGQMNGQLIANSFGGARWGSGELHDYRFDNDPPRASVPDVGSTFVLGLLGIGLLVLLKRLR